MPQMYSVADKFREILQRDKAEALQQQALERQMQLDELAKRQAESRMKYDEENLKSLQDQRKAAADDRIYRNLLSGPHSMGDDVSNLGADYLRVGQETGLVQKRPDSIITTEEQGLVPNAQGETDETFDHGTISKTTVTPGKGFQFRGRPDEVKIQQRYNRVGETLQALARDKDMPEHMKMLLIAQAMGSETLPASFYSSMEPKQDMGIVTPTGTIKPAINPRTNQPYQVRGNANPLLELNHPPQPTAATQPYLYQDTVNNKSYWLRPGEQPSPANAISTNLIRGNPPAATSKYPKVLADPMAIRLSEARTRLGSGFWVSGTNRRNYANLAQTAIGQAAVSHPVKQIAMNILQSPAYDQKGALEIAAEYRAQAGQDPVSQKQVNELEALLMEVIGEKVE